MQPCIEDGLPRLICKECSRQLKRTYAFNIQCEESEQKLKFLLENPSESNPKEDCHSDGIVKDELSYEYEKNENKCKTNDETQLPIFDDNSKDENKDSIKLGKFC